MRVGKRFGSLKPKSYIGDGRWLCDCGCGSSVTVDSTDLSSGAKRNCGCDLAAAPSKVARKPKERHKRRSNSIQVASPRLAVAPGKVVYFLRVQEYLEHGVWRCICACGGEVLAPANRLASGRIRSCGCSTNVASTKEYGAWSNMRARCHNPKSVGYSDYGAKGVKVCRRWRGSFLAFLNDVGPAPTPKHSLDRIHPERNYEPGNVRWATADEQAANKRPPKTVYEGGVVVGETAKQRMAWRCERAYRIIQECKSGTPQYIVALKYGVSESLVSRYINGERLPRGFQSFS